jgi:hypothetical protein
VAERLGHELVPNGLWEIVAPLLPPHRERPQGGGTRYVEDRAVFTAVVYVRQPPSEPYSPCGDVTVTIS